MEKIIQLPFQIPRIERSDMAIFVSSLVKEWPHEECRKVFSEGLAGNPRQTKRIINVFLMLWKLSQNRGEKLKELIKPVRLAKVIVLQHTEPELFEVFRTPRYLSELEGYFRKVDSSSYDAGELSPLNPIEPLPALIPFVQRPKIQIVNFTTSYNERCKFLPGITPRT